MGKGIKWDSVTTVGGKSYTCGHCGNKVAPNLGYLGKYAASSTIVAHIMICPFCTYPTFLEHVESWQVPSIRLGHDVKGITDAGVENLYNEARNCSSVGAYTGTVLLSRKILMNLAVQQGADEGKSFISYIDFLEAKGYVPPNGKDWVDVIRKKGNEATHEISLMTQTDAAQILHFVEMLLRFIYEFPSLLEP